MKIFLDVGAHNGETAKIALEPQYGFDKVYCFEPVVESSNKIKTIEDNRLQVCEYGLWNKTCDIKLYSPENKGFHSASVYRERFNDKVVVQDVKMVRASTWFTENLRTNDQVYLKLNCEGSECIILQDLIDSGAYKNISVLMVDFDVRKIPSQAHLMDKMKAQLAALNIPEVFYIDEYDLGRRSHDSFTHFWLDKSQKSKSKILDGLKLKGQPAEIPNCGRDDLPGFFRELGFRVGVEIGVNKGEYSVLFAKEGFEFYAIDPWISYSDYEDSRGQERLDFLYEHTKRVLSPYPNATVLRNTSMEAAGFFRDESLDFVYIDGNHQFKYVAEDLAIWSSKLKKGGVLAGHDYIYTNPRTQAGICHVIYVVDAFTKAYKIDNWYLLGEKHAKEGEKRDRFRSYMWIKNYESLPSLL